MPHIGGVLQSQRTIVCPAHAAEFFQKQPGGSQHAESAATAVDLLPGTRHATDSLQAKCVCDDEALVVQTVPHQKCVL